MTRSGLRKGRGLFVLRAQPIHRGHLNAIGEILSEVEELVIVIGSAQVNYTLENPFTVGERIEMVRLALREGGIDPDKVYVVPLPDIHSHRTWVAHVLTFSPSFDVVYTNNPTVALPFKDAGYEVRPIPLYRRDLYSSTNIRERMLADEKWQNLVPLSVVSFIKKIHGVERLRSLSKWHKA